ncbi:MAG TPA: YraN family protein [Limnochordales bacterium]
MSHAAGDLGRAAEAAAARYLAARGWRILARNARRRTGEIDLVAVDPHGVLVFVEVRARRAWGPDSGRDRAAESVDERKRRRLIHAARAFLACRPELLDLPARFDVVAVETAPSGQPGEFEHLIGAFDLG